MLHACARVGGSERSLSSGWCSTMPSMKIRIWGRGSVLVLSPGGSGVLVVGAPRRRRRSPPLRGPCALGGVEQCPLPGTKPSAAAPNDSIEYRGWQHVRCARSASCRRVRARRAPDRRAGDPSTLVRRRPRRAVAGGQSVADDCIGWFSWTLESSPAATGVFPVTLAVSSTSSVSPSRLRCWWMARRRRTRRWRRRRRRLAGW